MKKISLLILTGLAFEFSNAQWSINGSNIYYNTGHVGIGTSSPSTFWGKVLQVYDNNNAALSVKTSVADWQVITDASGGLHFRDITGGGNSARLFISSNGNIGIGTTTPRTSLDVMGNLYANRPAAMVDWNGNHTIGGPVMFTPSNFGPTYNGYLSLTYPDNNTIRFGTDYDGHIAGNNYRNLQFGRAGDPYLTIQDGGNVGIGIATPLNGITNAGLHIAKGDHSSIIIGNPITENYGGIVQTSDNKHRIFIGANLYDDPTYSWKNFQSGKGGAGISILADKGIWGTSIEFYATEQDGVQSDIAKMVIKGDGSVGIGTSNTNNPSYALFVEKGIRTRKVRVDQSSWADYVFEPAYKLPSLKIVESFIQQYKHLPDVPSAAEVEENGLDLGENQAVLLKKIEELTLYIIEQNKKLEKLEKEMAEIKKEKSK